MIVKIRFVWVLGGYFLVKVYERIKFQNRVECALHVHKPLVIPTIL